MKKLKSILIDDEPKNLELLSYYLEKYSTDTEIVGSFSEKRAALEYHDNEDNLSELDIIFLDMIRIADNNKVVISKHDTKFC